MRVYRIALELYAKTARAAFNGIGGMYGLGRWHTQGRPVVYAAESLSLSALEALVHLKRSTRIEPPVQWEAEIPDGLMEEAKNLPADWILNMKATQAYGDAWLAGRSAPALVVPSAIIPAERNVVINPLHPAFDLAWVVVGPVPFEFDTRLVAP